MKQVVVIREDEDQAINKLDEFKKNLLISQQSLSNQQEKLMERKNELKSEIVAQFNELIAQLNKEQERVLEGLDEKIEEYHSEMNEKVAEIMQKEEMVVNLMSTNDLTTDDRDPIMRKLSITNDTLWQQQKDTMEQQEKEHLTEYVLDFNIKPNAVSSFLKTLGNVEAKEINLIPEISDIAVDARRTRRVKVKWNAKLHEDIDFAMKAKTKLIMQWKLVNVEITEITEEEKSDMILTRHGAADKYSVDSKLITFHPKQSEYQYVFKNLERNDQYRFKLHFFQTETGKTDDLKLVKILHDEELIFNTGEYDINDIKFRYSSDYDHNGICYWLGTNYGENNYWLNPALLKKIRLTSSGWSSYHGELKDMLERKAKKSYSKDIKDGYVEFDFGELYIKPTHYTLRTGDFTKKDDHTKGFMKNWNLSASRDGVDWKAIDEHSPWKSPFRKAGESKTFEISAKTYYYNRFRIKMTGKNAKGNHRITFNGFEIYGYVKGNQQRKMSQHEKIKQSTRAKQS